MNASFMITPVIAGLPPSALSILLLFCVAAATVGGVVVRRMRRHRCKGDVPIPLSAVAIVTGPTVGLLLALFWNWAHLEELTPAESRHDFWTIMQLTTIAGAITAAVLLLLVDLRPWKAKNGPRNFDVPTG